MTSRERWLGAQQYERGYWAKRRQEISSGETADLGWYRWRADRLVQLLQGLGRPLSEHTASILEIGSGPVGIVGFLPGATRVAVDPLSDYYGSDPVFSASRSEDAEYRQGLGEDLPAPDAAFDLVVIENCIDHVQDIPAVMAEIRRVLKPNGMLYLTVNCRSRPGYWVHRVLSRLRIDAGHPHTFTPRRARKLMHNQGFQIIDFQVESYLRALRQDLRSSHLRDRAKALLGVSEYLSSVVAVRQ